MICRILSIMIALSCVSPQILKAQDMIRFNTVADSSRIQIDGTSTLHDWTVVSQAVGGYMEMASYVLDGALFSETAMTDTALVPATVHVEVPVLSLQHDENNEGLEESMYRALKSENHPVIAFHLTIGRRLPAASKDRVRVTGSGNLTIAGFSRYVDLAVDLIRLSGDRLKIIGETTLKMTDYKIKKPTALLGAIRTGDEVTIRFEWVTERGR